MPDKTYIRITRNIQTFQYYICLKLHKSLCFTKIKKSIYSPEINMVKTKIRKKSSLKSSDSIIIKLFFPNQTINQFEIIKISQFLKIFIFYQNFLRPMNNHDGCIAPEKCQNNAEYCLCLAKIEVLI